MKPNDNYLFHCSYCGYYVADIVDGNSQYDELLERWAKGDELIELCANEMEKHDVNFSYHRLYCEVNYCPHCGKKVDE